VCLKEKRVGKCGKEKEEEEEEEELVI